MNKFKKMYTAYIRTIRILLILLILFQIISCCVYVFISFDGTLTKATSTLLTSTNKVLTGNINNYLTEVEDITNVFVDDIVKLITDSEDKNDIYKSDQIDEMFTKAISHKNFTDFALVFSDGTYTGHLSTDTVSSFPKEKLYQNFSNGLLDEGDGAKWFTGFENTYSKIYYAKYVDNDALVLCSLSGYDFENIFRDAEELTDITVRYISDDFRMIYSSSGDETGEIISDDMLNIISDKDNISQVTDGIVIASDTCKNGWQIISTVSINSLMGNLKNIKSIYILVSIILLLIISVVVSIHLIYTRKRYELLSKLDLNLSDDIDTGVN